jgi:hypothetical protein
MRRARLVAVILSVLGAWTSVPLVRAADADRVVIDADTANEVDDPFAIVRALVEPGLQLVGLSAAQWQVSHWATPTTLEDSQRLNEVLAGHLGRGDPGESGRSSTSTA